MSRYLVTWRIDVFDAENAEEAAQKAHDIMVNEFSTAVVFDVQEKDAQGRDWGMSEEIDLLDEVPTRD